MTEKTEDVTLFFDCDEAPETSWTVVTGTYAEALNRPYELTLNLATDDLSAEPIRMLGRSCRLTVQRGALVRPISGIVSEVREGSTHPLELTTTITVSPSFTALSLRVNTKIFQDKTVPEILEMVLGEGLGAYNRSVDLRLNRTYPRCEYRTQYNEPDRAFCERLMEEEGIAYWFEHSEGAPEVMVLSDDANNFGEVECLQTGLPASSLLYSLYEGGVEGHEYISSFVARSQLRPTKVATRHFDWTHPSTLREAVATEGGPSEPPNGALLPPEREVYQHDDHPLTFHGYDGSAFTDSDMNDQVRLRREAQAHDSRVAEGRSTVLGVTAGQTFTLIGHPQHDLAGEYLILSSVHTFDDVRDTYENTFDCIPAEVVYRPARVTPKPRVAGLQTAKVVGPSGEEIHTDVHGRIKVQFHWDRLGSLDDHSSCWIRVMQPWGGTGWGFVFIPRIGMEVIVNFINGDPDLPLVVGSVYNTDNPLPYPLPDEKTKSTIKTNSSLGGDGFNELRFEDKKSEEEIFIHAEKDFNEVVEHDHYTLVHHDQTNEVDNDHTELIHHDQMKEVDNDHTELIHRDQALTVDRHRDKHIKGNESHRVDGFKQKQIGDTYTVTVANEITFVTGKSSITLVKDGTIDIKGKTLTLNGSSLIKLLSAKIEEN